MKKKSNNTFECLNLTFAIYPGYDIKFVQKKIIKVTISDYWIRNEINLMEKKIFISAVSDYPSTHKFNQLSFT